MMEGMVVRGGRGMRRLWGDSPPTLLRRGSGRMSSTVERPRGSSNSNVEDLNMMSATKILLSQSRRPKRFGFDFHLWQFFMACLPSLGLYLLALYSRSEMRRMEKERAEHEAKLKAEKDKELKHKEEESSDKGEDINPSKKSGSITREDFQALLSRLDAMERNITELRSSKAKDENSINLEKGRSPIQEPLANDKKEAIIDPSKHVGGTDEKNAQKDTRVSEHARKETVIKPS